MNLYASLRQLTPGRPRQPTSSNSSRVSYLPTTVNADRLHSQTEKRSKKIIDDATEFYAELVSSDDSV